MIAAKRARSFAGNVSPTSVWIDTNQLGRRNLTPDQASLLRGRRYKRTQRQGERTDLTFGARYTYAKADIGTVADLISNHRKEQFATNEFRKRGRKVTPGAASNA